VHTANGIHVYTAKGIHVYTTIHVHEYTAKGIHVYNAMESYFSCINNFSSLFDCKPTHEALFYLSMYYG
jgi:hypothetical protein